MPFNTGDAYNNAIDGITKVPILDSIFTNPILMAIIITLFITLIIFYICFILDKSTTKKTILIALSTFMITTLFLIVQNTIKNRKFSKFEGQGEQYLMKSPVDMNNDNINIEPSLREQGRSSYKPIKHDDFDRHYNKHTYDEMRRGASSENDDSDRFSNKSGSNMSDNSSVKVTSIRDLDNAMKQVGDQVLNDDYFSQEQKIGTSSMLDGTSDINMPDQERAVPVIVPSYEVIPSSGNSNRQLKNYKPDFSGLKDL